MAPAKAIHKAHGKKKGGLLTPGGLTGDIQSFHFRKTFWRRSPLDSGGFEPDSKTH